MIIGLILLSGVLSLVYGGVTVSQLMASDAGSQKMQEISGAVAEGARCLGISQKGERRDPSNSDGFCAIAGEPLQYWGNGAKDIPAQIGGSVTAGDELKAMAGGLLITATTAGDRIVAVAKQSGIATDIIDVDVAIRFKM